MKRSVLVTLYCALLFFSCPSMAEWHSGKDDDGLPYTFTINDSGNMFGQWCNKEADACFWILATTRSCDTGIDIPGLLNTETGAVSIRLKCMANTVLGGKVYHRLVFSSFDVVSSSISGNKRIAIAIPLQDVGFTVTRFDTTGVDAAINRIDIAKRLYFETRAKKSTRDQQL